MIILLTGGTGFVGKSIAKHLEKKRLRLLVRKRTSEMKGDVIEGSLTDQTIIDKAMNGVDVVIHAAAILDADSPEIEEVNIKATEMLVDAAKKYRIKQFIFISTENVLHNGQDAYSQSKKLAEEKVRQFPQHLILREPVVYGQGDKRYIGKIVKYIKKWPFIPIPGSGKFTLQPIYVEDIPKYIEQGIKLKKKGTYLVVGPESITYKEFIKKIMEIMQKKKVLLHIPILLLKLGVKIVERCKIQPPLTSVQISNMTMNRKYDITEQIKVFKIRPTSLEEGLRKTLQTKSL